jgi:hypothetical protein
MDISATQERHEYFVHDVWKASPTRFPILHLALQTGIRVLVIEYFVRYNRPFVAFRFDARFFSVLISMVVSKATGQPEVPGILSIKICNPITTGRSSSAAVALQFRMIGEHTLAEVLDVLRGRSSILPEQFASNLFNFSFLRTNTGGWSGSRDWM